MSVKWFPFDSSDATDRTGNFDIKAANLVIWGVKVGTLQTGQTWKWPKMIVTRNRKDNIISSNKVREPKPYNYIRYGNMHVIFEGLNTGSPYKIWELIVKLYWKLSSQKVNFM